MMSDQAMLRGTLRLTRRMVECALKVIVCTLMKAEAHTQVNQCFAELVGDWPSWEKQQVSQQCEMAHGVWGSVAGETQTHIAAAVDALMYCAAHFSGHYEVMMTGTYP